jgi:hypothetical protein
MKMSIYINHYAPFFIFVLGVDLELEDFRTIIIIKIKHFYDLTITID